MKEKRLSPGSSPGTPQNINNNSSPRQHGEVNTMKTTKINLYTFEELNQDAQQAVIDRERNETYGFSFLGCENAANEIYDTIKAFADVFGVSFDIKDDHGTNFISFTVDHIEDEEATGKYLLRFINSHYNEILSPAYYYHNGKSRHSKIIFKYGNCPFTGLCWDCDILQPIVDWYQKPDFKKSIHDIIDECFCAVLNAKEREDEYCHSDEYISDMIIANWLDKLYYENGQEYDGPAIDELEEAA